MSSRHFRFRPNVLARQRQEPEENLILIDTDAGTDDAWALFMALAAHKAYSTTGVRIVGITTVCGNASVENVSKNVTRTLQTANETSIPIFQGLGEYVMEKFKHYEEPPHHGYDGFGDADLPPISARIESEHAVDAIIRLTEQYKGRLTIIALGPLTNLAMAIKMKPDIGNWLKQVYILGGNMDALGNVSSSAEFNFFVDAEAAAITVDSYPPGSLNILPWEACLKATSTYEFRTAELGTMDTPEIHLLNAIEATNLGKFKDSWLPPDAVVMACAIDSSIILASEEHYARVEVNGTHTRGMLAVDKANNIGKSPNVRLITNVNLEIYESYLKWAAGDSRKTGAGDPLHCTSKNSKRARLNASEVFTGNPSGLTISIGTNM